MPAPRKRPELTPEFMAHMSPEFQALMRARSDERRVPSEDDFGPDDEALLAFESLERGGK